MRGSLALPRLEGGGSSPTRPSTIDPFAVPSLQSEEKRVTVLLNVYSLIDSNKTLGKIGMGVFHTGVVLYGIEWGYGECPGCPESTGLFLTRPGTACGTLFRTVNLGVTTISPEDVDVILHQLEREWRGGDYHILDHNCNHFAQTFCDCLSTVELLELPPWCNRAARVTNRVVPRRLATKLKNMMDPPDAKEKYAASSGQAQSVIPPNWYKHPSVFRTLKNVPHREREARPVAHTRASRSFTSISAALDDMGSIRTEDGFYFGADDTESCCSRVLPLASVELQPQLLDQMRLRRRGSSISMSTDRMSLHSIELATRKAGLGPRGRGRARGGGVRGGGAGGDPLTHESSTVSKATSVRRRGRHFAAPTEASLRREGLSTTQVAEVQCGSSAGGGRRHRSSVGLTTPASTPKSAKAAMNGSATGKAGAAKVPSPGRTEAQLTAHNIARLGIELSGTAGDVLDSPMLSDISERSEEDAVEMETSPTQAPLVMHAMPTSNASKEEEDGPVIMREHPRGTTTTASKEASPSKPQAPEPDSGVADDDDDEDPFSFFRHLDPSTLAGPVGILMVKKSRRRAKSIQERKELLLRAMNQSGPNGTASGGSGSGSEHGDSHKKSATAPAPAPQKAAGSAVLPPVESVADDDDGDDNDSFEDDEAVPPATSAMSAAATGASKSEAVVAPTTAAPRLRAVSDATPSPTGARLTPLPQGGPYPRRHTISTRIVVEEAPSIDGSPFRPMVASSVPLRRRLSTSQTSSSRAFHLPPMTVATTTAVTDRSNETEDAASSARSGDESGPVKAPFEIQTLAAQGFAGLAHAPPGPAPARYPRRGSLPSLSSQQADPGFPSSPPPTAAAADEKETPASGDVHPSCPKVVRQRSPTYPIGADTSGTPMSLPTHRPTPLQLVEKPFS